MEDLLRKQVCEGAIVQSLGEVEGIEHAKALRQERVC